MENPEEGGCSETIQPLCLDLMINTVYTDNVKSLFAKLMCFVESNATWAIFFTDMLTFCFPYNINSTVTKTMNRSLPNHIHLALLQFVSDQEYVLFHCIV